VMHVKAGLGILLGMIMPRAIGFMEVSGELASLYCMSTYTMCLRLQYCSTEIR
jgi:hypothetical protein